MPGTDNYKYTARELDSPAERVFAVTPDDNTDLTIIPRGLWVGVQGNVEITDIAGNTNVFVGVQGMLPVRAVRVKAASTTATNILGLY